MYGTYINTERATTWAGIKKEKEAVDTKKSLVLGFAIVAVIFIALWS